eukprot:442614-Prorocentrum_minimum.AAC.1
MPHSSAPHPPICEVDTRPSELMGSELPKERRECRSPREEVTATELAAELALDMATSWILTPRADGDQGTSILSPEGTSETLKKSQPEKDSKRSPSKLRHRFAAKVQRRTVLTSGSIAHLKLDPEYPPPASATSYRLSSSSTSARDHPR